MQIFLQQKMKPDTQVHCRAWLRRQYGFGCVSTEQILQVQMLQSVTKCMQDRASVQERYMIQHFKKVV